MAKDVLEWVKADPLAIPYRSRESLKVKSDRLDSVITVRDTSEAEVPVDSIQSDSKVAAVVKMVKRSRWEYVLPQNILLYLNQRIWTHGGY